MNDETQKQLIEWIQGLSGAVSEELPLFIQEIATYGFYEGVITAILSLFAGLAFGIFAYYMVRRASEESEKDLRDQNMGAVIFLGLGGIFVGLASVIFLCSGMPNAICRATKAKLAPKLYAIERLTKGNG